jgi:ABC-2 type transport system ATP-binding protein
MTNVFSIAVKNLTLRKGDKTILDNVNFIVPKGVVCAFIGPNGAGKTTTIKSILGLYKYRHNTSITLEGKDSRKAATRQIVGYVPEKENFPKVRANSFFYQMSSLYGLTREQYHLRIAPLLKLFEIDEISNRQLTVLSSGQKKKLLIIQALIHNPELVIMDEPTENMDPDARQTFYKIVKKLKDENKTIFISTHNLDEIQRFANYVVVIKNGQIQHTGPISSNTNLYKVYNEYKGDKHHVDNEIQFIKAETTKDSSENTLSRYETLLNDGLINQKEFDVLKKLAKGKK